jgi:hypothetical protein
LRLALTALERARDLPEGRESIGEPQRERWRTWREMREIDDALGLSDLCIAAKACQSYLCENYGRHVSKYGKQEKHKFCDKPQYGVA